MKPPFAYYGGKVRLADRIVSMLPDHGHYIGERLLAALGGAPS